eukprot:COSAG01_NODE_3789_length_5692_cov_82.776685_4_plen_346_part_00
MKLPLPAVLLLLLLLPSPSSPAEAVGCSTSFRRRAGVGADLRLSTSNSSFDSWNMFAPFVAQVGTRWHLYYSGGPDTKPAYLAYQLGLATSSSPKGPWTKHGTPLLPLGAVDNFHATPTLLRGVNNRVVKEGGVYSMLYCGNRNDSIYRATSKDGIVWKKNNTKIFTGYAPNVLRGPDGQLWLYSIAKPNGRPWEVTLAKGRDWDSLRTMQTVLISNTQPWEAGNLFYPYAMYDDLGGWTLAWSAYSNSSTTHRGIPCKKDPSHLGRCYETTAIGLAHSRDGQAWTKCSNNPVLAPLANSFYDATYVGCPSLVTAGTGVDTPLLYYAGRIDQHHKYFSIAHVGAS